MSIENCFTQPCPPLVETFSFRRVPCQFEQSSQPAGSGQYDPGGEPCPFLDYCTSRSRALWRLELAYGPWLKVTLAEPSSSIVVRSEHQFNKQERHRLALRKHIYELSADQGESLSRTRRKDSTFIVNDEYIGPFAKGRLLPEKVIRQVRQLDGNSYSSAADFARSLRCVLEPDDYSKYHKRLIAEAFSPVDCYLIDRSDRLGHYVGFVDLRPKPSASPLAMGILGLPRKYRHNGNVFIITGAYGPLFGGPSFRATIYSMHDPGGGGSKCAQACVMMALGFLADRGARIHGSYTLTYLAKCKNPKLIGPGNTDDPQLTHDPDHLGNVPTNASSRWSFGAGRMHPGLELHEIVALLNRCDVHADWFFRKTERHLEGLAERLIEAYVLARFPVIMALDSGKWWARWGFAPKNRGHAVVVIGIRRHVQSGRGISLITHDPGFMPYFERPLNECFEACAALHTKRALSLVFVAQGSIKVHAQDCVRRLLDSNDVWEFEPSYNLAPEYDYRIGLVVRDNIAETIYDRTAILARKFVRVVQRQVVSTLPRTRYWCIAMMAHGKLHTVWVFDSRWRPSDATTPWKARMRFAGRLVTYEWIDEKGNRQRCVLQPGALE